MLANRPPPSIEEVVIVLKHIIQLIPDNDSGLSLLIIGIRRQESGTYNISKQLVSQSLLNMHLRMSQGDPKLIKQTLDALKALLAVDMKYQLSNRWGLFFCLQRIQDETEGKVLIIGYPPGFEMKEKSEQVIIEGYMKGYCKYLFDYMTSTAILTPVAVVSKNLFSKFFSKNEPSSTTSNIPQTITDFELAMYWCMLHGFVNRLTSKVSDYFEEYQRCFLLLDLTLQDMLQNFGSKFINMFLGPPP